MPDVQTTFTRFLNALAGAVTGTFGVPVTVGYGRTVGATAAVSSVATYTPGSDGSFVVAANVLVTTATTHSFTVECAYTDEGNTARTATLTWFNVSAVAGTVVSNTNGTVPYMYLPQTIRAKGGTAITIRTQAAGTYTTVVYNVEGWIQQLV